MRRAHRVLAVLAAVCCLGGSPIVAQAPAARASTAAKTDAAGKYPTVAMHHGKLSWDKSHGVQYFDERQREERRIEIREGKVYTAAGKPQPDTHSKHRNQGNYVMDAAGNFYLFDEWTTPTIRHSSIFAGGPVAAAGNIQITGGRIVYIDGESGHYGLRREHFRNVLKELEAHGVDLKLVHARP